VVLRLDKAIYKGGDVVQVDAALSGWNAAAAAAASVECARGSPAAKRALLSERG
jgi:hypothetical protein